MSRPSLVSRKGSSISRPVTDNKSMDELAARVDDQAKSDDSPPRLVKRVSEVVAELSEEKGTGVEETEEQTGRQLSIGNQTLVTPGGFAICSPLEGHVFQNDNELKYREGGHGCVQFINDNVCAPIYPPGIIVSEWTPMHSLPPEVNPATNKSYETMWWTQQEILIKALVMEGGLLKYRNIVFCWPRGDGKSYLACLVQLWKFFNWPRQQIMLGANSKDQVKFVHFDILRDMISNSPNLFQMIGGQKNIQEKEIRLLDGGVKGKVVSMIRSISSFSGIVSNITGYTFSEIFDMKKPKFYTQLDGSIRNVPNALGVIDSTVSDKTHILYQLYNNYMEGKVKTLFFSYRCSKTGDPEDYMHPYMSADQLNDYRAKFPFGEFERYFLNTWEAGRQKLFDDHTIEALNVIGIDGGLMNNMDIMEAMRKKIEFKDMAVDNQRNGFESDYAVQRIIEIENRARYLSEIVSFDANGFCTMDMIERLSELFDTDWALLAGIDFADPLAVRSTARSILSLNLKGLIGSRSNPYGVQLLEAAPKWLYIKVGLFVIDNHSMDKVKKILDMVNDEFDGIDKLTCERYGAWDVAKWCEDRMIDFEPVYPNYERQKAAFKELYLAIKEGRMKSPPIPVNGSKQKDIYREELGIFDHDLTKKAFGSPEKAEKGGIQDDSIYADAWSLYGGRDKGIDDFRMRKKMTNFGMFFRDTSVTGSY